MSDFLAGFVQFITAFLALLLIGGLIYVAYLYWQDIKQSQHAIRRNYPVIGRFRYFFEHLGEFFRQYFFAQDREELPFNRAQRTWVYRAAKDLDSTVAFGSTKPLNKPGDILFLNDLFPVLKNGFRPSSDVAIGEGYARTPYTTSSIFNISGMSFGALSAPAVTALAQGAAKAGIWMNTGEGSASEYHLKSGCDLVFQIGTAKYGVRKKDGSLDLDKLSALAEKSQIKMFEIKLSQGAKPGKGGILPAEKVTSVIASTRGIPTGVASLSPNGHAEIRSINDLLEFIHLIRETTGKPTGFKAVLGNRDWLHQLCLAIHEKGLGYAPDFITLDSADGGTGAAPQSLMDVVGLPLRTSLPLLIDALNQYGLKQRIKVVASGKLINPADVAWALCIGADFVVSARGFMFALGCIQALQCNKNTCPTGITTHNRELQRGLDPQLKSERVLHYADNLKKEVAIIAHTCGVAEPRLLNRRHAAIIGADGYPEPLLTRYPDVETLVHYRTTETKNTAASADSN